MSWISQKKEKTKRNIFADNESIRGNRTSQCACTPLTLSRTPNAKAKVNLVTRTRFDSAVRAQHVAQLTVILANAKVLQVDFRAWWWRKRFDVQHFFRQFDD